MRKLFKLIPTYLLWILFLISIVIILMVYLGGGTQVDINGETWSQPTYTDTLLNWAYTLCFATIGITLIISLAKFIMDFIANPAKGIKSLVVLVLFVAVFFISWNLGSEKPIEITGYDGTDNAGVMARFSDMCLYVTYTLVVGTLLAWIGSSLYSKIK